MTAHIEPAWSQAVLDIIAIDATGKPPQISKPIRVVTR
jgi:hypothetical protein